MSVNSQPAREIIKLAIEAGRTPYLTYAEFELDFQRSLGCALDYVRRLLAGTRTLRESHVQKIRHLLQLPRLELTGSLRDAAIALGLSHGETEALVRRSLGGIDFAARTGDRRSVQNLHNIIQGYWEIAHWSFSRVDEQVLSRELCIIDGITEGNFVACRSVDVNFTYSGVVFPVLNHLYFIFEKDRLFDELVVLLTNRPDRASPVLRGITMALSGGVDELNSYPSAGKIAFRHLGHDANAVRRHYPDAPRGEDELEAYLSKHVPKYISKSELASLGSDAASRLQLQHLDNTISRAAKPFALRAST